MANRDLRATQAAQDYDVPEGFRRDSHRIRNFRFEERLMAAGRPHLVYPDPPKERRGDPVRGFIVHLGTLERMNIHHIQKELLDVVREIMREDENPVLVDMHRAKMLLADYTNAIRDYDFMTAKQVESEQNKDPDPFEISTWDFLGYHIIRESGALPRETGHYPIDLVEPMNDISHDGLIENILPGSSRHAYNQRIDLANFWERLTMGILGGLALIGPMLLMVLKKGLLITLLTVSVSTILFASALAFFTQLKGETVLASVAAYAAVLVVFVGSNNSS